METITTPSVDELRAMFQQQLALVQQRMENLTLTCRLAEMQGGHSSNERKFSRTGLLKAATADRENGAELWDRPALSVDRADLRGGSSKPSLRTTNGSKVPSLGRCPGSLLLQRIAREGRTPQTDLENDFTSPRLRRG
jgi:hypothetical protein